MRWVKMTTQRSFTIAGKTIPSCLADGEARWLTVTDEEYNQMHKNPVFKALEKSGGVIVNLKMPTDVADSPNEVRNTNAQLRARVTELEEQLKGGVKDDGVTKKLEKDLKEKSKDLDEAVAMIKDLQAQLAAKGE